MFFIGSKAGQQDMVVVPGQHVVIYVGSHSLVQLFPASAHLATYDRAQYDIRETEYDVTVTWMILSGWENNVLPQ